MGAEVGSVVADDATKLGNRFDSSEIFVAQELTDRSMGVVCDGLGARFSSASSGDRDRPSAPSPKISINKLLPAARFVRLNPDHFHRPLRGNKGIASVHDSMLAYDRLCSVTYGTDVEAIPAIHGERVSGARSAVNVSSPYRVQL